MVVSLNPPTYAHRELTPVTLTQRATHPSGYFTSEVVDVPERGKVKRRDHVPATDVPDGVHQLHELHHLLIRPATHTHTDTDTHTHTDRHTPTTF